MIKLYLDDIRTPPGPGWIIVRTYAEAIDRLSCGDIQFASLDHDLADGHYPWVAGAPYPENDILVQRTKERTGYDVICWMEENNIWPEFGVVVHSQNPVGVQRIKVVIDKHYITMPSGQIFLKQGFGSYGA